jgi:hypothetical protein
MLNYLQRKLIQPFLEVWRPLTQEQARDRKLQAALVAELEALDSLDLARAQVRYQAARVKRLRGPMPEPVTPPVAPPSSSWGSSRPPISHH